MKFLRTQYNNYKSKIDQFCEKFDKTHPLSDSQKAEIRKYQRIYELRDNLAQPPGQDGEEG